MMVVLSEHNLEVTEGFEQVFNVSKIYVHNYNYKTYDNDIMLIKVSRNVSVLQTNDTWSTSRGCVAPTLLSVTAERAGGAKRLRPACHPA